MIRMLRRAALALLLCSCVGTTGSGLVTFTGYGAGPVGVHGAYTFPAGAGYTVTLTAATLHVGAMYVTDSAPTMSSANTSCVNPGRYVLQVPYGTDINLLSDAPQLFPYVGSGTADPTLTGEVWLVHATADTQGDTIDEESDPLPVVTLAGQAARDGVTYPFTASVTIGDNRAKKVSDPAQPGLNPICKRRIIAGIPAALKASDGGRLVLRVDPAGWFNLVDFASLASLTGAGAPPYAIPDTDAATAGASLFTGILTGVLPSGQSAYSFSFEKLPPAPRCAPPSAESPPPSPCSPARRSPRARPTTA
jgi:hypothetical protein